MEKENQRVLLTKQLLQNALLRLLQKQSIDKIYVKELCAEAGINRSTFYRYYNLPKDILLEIENELLCKMSVAKVFKTKNDVRMYLQSTFEYLFDNADLLQLLLKNSSADDFEMLMQNFANSLMEMEPYAKLDPAKVGLISSYIGGGGFYAVRRWLKDGISVSPTELTDFTMDVLFRYITSIT